jgi:hypothetical protein
VTVSRLYDCGMPDISPATIRARLKRAGDVENAEGAPEPTRAQREATDAEENDPARIAPSAEGVTTFAGLPGEVRSWLSAQLGGVGNKTANEGAQRRKDPQDG